MLNLAIIWNDLTSKTSTDKALNNSLWQEIERNYSGKNRHYHNLNHLEFLIALAIEQQSNLNDFDAMLYSIFYHDIIYKTKHKDNEAKSAALAEVQLAKLNVSKERIQRVSQYIMATKTHEFSTDSDTNYLLDFDLAILGTSPEKYATYTKQIRKEYAAYPDFLYKPGRKLVLEHFLGLDFIYKTTVFRTELEEAARTNLKNELDVLSS